MVNKKTSFVLIICFAFLGEVLSIISLMHFVELHLGLRTTPSFCNFNAHYNCDAVTLSPYSTIFNVPIASYGGVFYFVLMLLGAAALSLKERAERQIAHTVFLLSVLACLFSFYLYLISEFVIKVLCPTCMAMYACNLLLLLSSYFAISTGVRAAWREGARNLWVFPRILLKGIPDRASRKWAVYGTIATVVVGLLFLATRGDWRENLISGRWKEQQPESFSFINEGVDKDFGRGNPYAPVAIVEFSDLECPACHAFSFDLDELLTDFGDSVRVVFKNFPLDKSCNPLMQHEMHQNACFLAQLARCAGEQDRFWETVSYFMDIRDFGPREKQMQYIGEVSKNVQLDEEALRVCVESGRHLAKIRADIAEGEKLKISGTPTIYVNGKLVPRLDRAELRTILKEAGGKY